MAASEGVLPTQAEDCAKSTPPTQVGHAQSIMTVVRERRTADGLLLVEPATADASPATLFAWCRENRVHLRAAVFSASSGLLLRGWDLQHCTQAEELIFDAIGFSRMEQYPKWFIDFNTRCERLGVPAGGLVQKRDSRNAPDASPSAIQPPHVEFGLGPKRPRVVAFFCETPPAQAGETALIYFPEAMASLSDTTRELLRTHGWWVPRSGVVQPALLVHPESGLETLQCYTFSHAQTPLVLQAWQQLKADSSASGRPDLPHIDAVPYSGPDHHEMCAVRADGALAPLGEACSLELCRAMLRTLRLHSWQRGDVLIVDNVLYAHFRMPGRQPRKLHALFAEEIDSRTLRRADAPTCVHAGAAVPAKGAIAVTLSQLGPGGWRSVIWLLSWLPDLLFRLAGQLFWAKNSPGARILGYAA